MSWHVGTVKPGDVLRITKLVNSNGIQMSDDAWGVVLDDEDMMVFEKREKDWRIPSSVAGWSSKVCPIDWADEDSKLAVADEVPADVPADFWPLAARLSLER